MGDICSNVCSGGTPSSTHSEYYDGNIPWLNTKEINFNRIYSTEKSITEEGLNNSSAKWIAINSIIVAMYGATAGKTAIAKIPLTTNQACCNLSINHEIADYRYVYYFLSYKYKELVSLANGGAQQNLNAQIIKDFNISLPSLHVQEQIASVLSSLDDKIELNKKISDNLEKQAQALFKHWFVDFGPFKNGEFVESELGMIPKGWKVGTLEDVGDVVGGGTPSKTNSGYYTTDGIHWLTPKDLSITKAKFTSKGSIDITEEGYNKSSAKLMPKGSVLFSSRAPIGYITIALNDICTNQGFKSVIPQKCGTAYIYYFLKTNTPIIEAKASGSTFKEASGSLMKSLPIIIPPDEIENEFDKLVNPMFLQQSLLEKESRRLATLRDTLLPKLMSGQIKL